MGTVYFYSIYVFESLVWSMINGRNKISILEHSCTNLVIVWYACSQRICQSKTQIGEENEC